MVINSFYQQAKSISWHCEKRHIQIVPESQIVRRYTFLFSHGFTSITCNAFYSGLFKCCLLSAFAARGISRLQNVPILLHFHGRITLEKVIFVVKFSKYISVADHFTVNII